MGVEKITFYNLFYDNRNKALKINFKYVLDSDQTANEFKDELCKYLEVEKNEIMLAFLSFKEIEFIVKDNTKISEIQEYDKSKNLFAI